MTEWHGPNFNPKWHAHERPALQNVEKRTLNSFALLKTLYSNQSTPCSVKKFFIKCTDGWLICCYKNQQAEEQLRVAGSIKWVEECTSRKQLSYRQRFTTVEEVESEQENVRIHQKTENYYLVRILWRKINRLNRQGEQR